MMIRSAPPASAHLAERPVPAPAPMIGLPAVDLGAQPRQRLVARHRAALGSSSCAAGPPSRRANAGSLTSSVELVHLDVGAERLAEAAEQRRVRRRDRGRPGPRPRSPRRPRSGTKSAAGPVAPDSLRPIRRPSSRALLRRRPHQRDRRVVHVEIAVARTAPARVSRGPKLTMSSAPSETTCGTPELAGRLEPVRAGREHAADELVGELRRRRRRARRR